MHTRSVVLQGWFGVDNFGDDLLLELTLEKLKESVPDKNIVVIGEGSPRPKLLSKQITYYPRESRKWAYFRNRQLRSGCNWILCGGSFFTEAAMDRFIVPARRVKAGGGRVLVHAAGLRDDFEAGSEKLQQFLTLVDGCSVREKFAQKLFSKFCPVSLVGDPVFAMPLIRAMADPGLLVIAPRGEPSLEIQQLRKLRSFIKAWIQNFGRVELLVCYPRQDHALATELAKDLEVGAVKIIASSTKHLSERIAVAGTILTMRLHPAIVSLAHGRIPWVLDAEHKHQMLMRESGFGKNLLTWSNIQPSLISSLTMKTTDSTPFRSAGNTSLDLVKKWIAE